jgi:hypothetical protein
MKQYRIMQEMLSSVTTRGRIIPRPHHYILPRFDHRRLPQKREPRKPDHSSSGEFLAAFRHGPVETSNDRPLDGIRLEGSITVRVALVRSGNAEPVANSTA